MRKDIRKTICHPKHGGSIVLLDTDSEAIIQVKVQDGAVVVIAPASIRVLNGEDLIQ